MLRWVFLFLFSESVGLKDRITDEKALWNCSPVFLRLFIIIVNRKTLNSLGSNWILGWIIELWIFE